MHTTTTATYGGGRLSIEAFPSLTEARVRWNLFAAPRPCVCFCGVIRAPPPRAGGRVPEAPRRGHILDTYKGCHSCLWVSLKQPSGSNTVARCYSTSFYNSRKVCLCPCIVEHFVLFCLRYVNSFRGDVMIRPSLLFRKYPDQ